MRSFISLNIELKIKEEIKKVQDLLKNKIGLLQNIRFENPKNFHITLFFIGEIKEGILNPMADALRQKIENKSGRLKFVSSQIGAFPDFKNPKVFFLNADNEGGRVFELAENVKQVLKEFGFESDKNFHPHITLARVKGKTKIKDLGDLNIGISFSVDKLSIMKSVITTKGAEHTEIFAINL